MAGQEETAIRRVMLPGVVESSESGEIDESHVPDYLYLIVIYESVQIYKSGE